MPPGTGVACNAFAKTLGFVSGLSNDDDAINDMECSVCDTDKCNSATVTKMSLFGLVLVAIAFLI